MLIKNLVSHLILNRDELVVLDMEACFLWENSSHQKKSSGRNPSNKHPALPKKAFNWAGKAVRLLERRQIGLAGPYRRAKKADGRKHSDGGHRFETLTLNDYP